MNIAMVVYAYYSRDARVRRYAESLARQGYCVDCICLREPFHPPHKNITFFHYPAERKRAGRWWYLFEYLPFFLFSFWTLAKNHLGKSYRLVHIHNIPEVLVFTAIIPRLTGAKVILDMHDPMPELYRDKYGKGENDPMVRLLCLLERLSLRAADHVITANDMFRRLFIRRGSIAGKRISIILNCPDNAIFYPRTSGKTNSHFTLIYAGTVEKRYNLELIIQAMPALAEKIPGIRCIIVPKLAHEGDYLERLRKTIQAKKLSRFIQIKPSRTVEQIASFLRTADIGLALVAPSVYTDTILSAKLMEYIQMDIPVIATRTKALSSVFSNTSLWLLNNNSETEFIQAVVALYRSPLKRKRQAQTARKYFVLHNWEGENKKYLQLVKVMTK